MKIITLTLLIIFTSCASYQNGQEAKVVDTKNNAVEIGDIRVTADINQEYSTEFFTYVQVDFGNLKDKWKDIKKVLIIDKDKHFKVVLGQRLNDWMAAIQNKIAVDRHNTAMIWGAVAAGAAAGMMGTNNTSSQKTYATVLAGAATAAEVNRLSNKISDIERARLFPANHLYSPFSLPPGLVNKRWILLNHKSGIQLDVMVFKVFFKNDKPRTYSVTLNQGVYAY